MDIALEQFDLTPQALALNLIGGIVDELARDIETRVNNITRITRNAEHTPASPAFDCITLLNEEAGIIGEFNADIKTIVQDATRRGHDPVEALGSASAKPEEYMNFPGIKPTCYNCKHGNPESGDESVGQYGSWVNCDHPQRDEAEIEGLQEKYGDFAARKCKLFEPVMTGTCGMCLKPIDVPLYLHPLVVPTFMGEFDMHVCSVACMAKAKQKYVDDAASHERTEREAEEYMNDVALHGKAGDIDHDPSP